MAKKARISLEMAHSINSNCLCFNLQKATRAVARAFDEAYKSLNLTNGQYSILMALNSAEPPSIGQLAEFFSTDRTTVTANLKPLIKRELVKLVVETEDRRTKLVLLTESGHELLAEGLKNWERANEAVAERIGKSQSKQLRMILKSVASAEAN